MSSLIEKMRLAREKAAAAAKERSAATAAAAPPLPPLQPSTATSTGPRAAAASPSDALPIEAPPSFLSPSSAVLRYRDAAQDPLCTVFSARLAVRVLQDTLAAVQEQRRQGPQRARVAGPGGLSGKRARSDEDADSATHQQSSAADRAVAFMSTLTTASVCAAADGGAAASRCRQPQCVGEGSATSERCSSPDDASTGPTSAYARACCDAAVDVSGAVRPPCGSVDRYWRKDRIAHGVYGVVFSAVDSRTVTTRRPPTGEATVGVPRESRTSGTVYALKHIKKQWLEESQVGFPPYLLREFDLLLRLHHPNIVAARELVVLDPDPLPGRVAARVESSTADSAKSKPQEDESKAKDLHGTNKAPAFSRIAHASDYVRVGPGASAGGGGDGKGSAEGSHSLASLLCGSTKDVFLVMEYCPYDLKNYMLRYGSIDSTETEHARTTAAATTAVAHAHGPQPYLHVTTRSRHCALVEANFLSRVKCIVRQAFLGLAFLHAHRVLHRDIKTSNVLIGEHGVVKLCDFGLGRYYREGQALTPTVVTLMYRAPELHLGVTDYSHAMDVWALGCVVAELFLKAPLFRASEENTHLLAVCEILGIPNEDNFPGVFKLPRAKEALRAVGRWNRTNKLAEVFKSTSSSACYDAHLLPPSGLDLLQRIFSWNPARRPSAAEVLRHPFLCEEPLPCSPEELMRPMPAPAEPHSESMPRPSGVAPAPSPSRPAAAAGALEAHPTEESSSIGAPAGATATSGRPPAEDANDAEGTPLASLAARAGTSGEDEEGSLSYSNAMSPVEAGAGGSQPRDAARRMTGVRESETEAEREAQQQARLRATQDLDDG